MRSLLVTLLRCIAPAHRLKLPLWNATSFAGATRRKVASSFPKKGPSTKPRFLPWYLGSSVAFVSLGAVEAQQEEEKPQEARTAPSRYRRLRFGGLGLFTGVPAILARVAHAAEAGAAARGRRERDLSDSDEGSDREQDHDQSPRRGEEEPEEGDDFESPAFMPHSADRQGGGDPVPRQPSQQPHDEPELRRRPDPAPVEDELLSAAEQQARLEATLREHPEFRAPFEVFGRKLSEGRLALRQEDFTHPLSWKALGYFLAACRSVRSLRLQGMKITEEEARALGQAALRQLRHVTFCGNSLGMSNGSLEVLVALLLLCDYLESAAFVRNSLSDRHVPDIAKLVSEHPSLESLDLCWNGIGDPGAVELAMAIRKLKYSLAKIDFSYNQMGPQGLASLRAAQEAHLRRRGRVLHLNWPGNGPIADLVKARREREAIAQNAAAAGFLGSVISRTMGQTAPRTSPSEGHNAQVAAVRTPPSAYAFLPVSAPRLGLFATTAAGSGGAFGALGQFARLVSRRKQPRATSPVTGPSSAPSFKRRLLTNYERNINTTLHLSP